MKFTKMIKIGQIKAEEIQYISNCETCRRHNKSAEEYNNKQKNSQ